MVVDGGVVKTWSSTQASVAQSSGEAEFYAAARGAAEGLGMISIMSDLGWSPRLRIHVDSSAAKAVASRSGLGKVRHLEVRFLWLQEVVKRRRLTIHKIRGTVNPADVLTKSLSILNATTPMEVVGFKARREGERGVKPQRWADMEDPEDADGVHGKLLQ